MLFNNLGPLERALAQSLDPACKGFAELDDLAQEVQSQYEGPLKDMLLAYIGTLEYKNSEKVFYSPLFGQVAPYFRYAKRFDNFEVVDKFNRELLSIDTNAMGFVPLNLFRSILEHELKIKEKIVLDFIGNLRETDQSQHLQSLDVNLSTNSLRAHIDYVVLLRKLAHYFELRQSKEEPELLPSEPHPDAVVLSISIESAMRLRSPQSELEAPNASVVLQLPFGQPQRLQTAVIQRSAYPAWNLRNQQVTFPLTSETLRHIIEYPLEFEVYHQQPGMRVSSQLIGVAHVDLSQMVFVDGLHQVAGYFHIVRRDRFQDGQHVAFANPHRLSAESLGQLKLAVTSNTSLKRTAFANPLTRSVARDNSPLAARAQSHLDLEVEAPAITATQQRLEQSFNQMAQEHSNVSLAERMAELDSLHRSLLQRARNASPERPDFRMTMGHGQSQELRQSFQAFAYRPVLPLPTAEPVLEEEREESFRRDNVFENNISQSSNLRQSEDEALHRQQEEEAKALNEILNPDSVVQPQYFGTFNQRQREQPGVTNVFAESMLLGRNRLSVTEDDEEVPVTAGAGLGTSVPHRGIVSSQDEDEEIRAAADDEFDERELRRVERILRQQKD